MDIDVYMLRTKLGLTPDELAAELGASPVTIWRWENGDRKPRGYYAKALLALSQKPKRKNGKMSDLTCAHRSHNGVTCGEKAETYIGGKWLCALHVLIVAKGKRK